LLDDPNKKRVKTDEGGKLLGGRGETFEKAIPTENDAVIRDVGTFTRKGANHLEQRTQQSEIGGRRLVCVMSTFIESEAGGGKTRTDQADQVLLAT